MDQSFPFRKCCNLVSRHVGTVTYIPVAGRHDNRHPVPTGLRSAAWPPLSLTPYSPTSVLTNVDLTSGHLCHLTSHTLISISGATSNQDSV